MPRLPTQGFAARWPDDCPRCPRPILPGDRVVRTHAGVLIHVGCAGGQDDE